LNVIGVRLAADKMRFVDNQQIANPKIDLPSLSSLPTIDLTPPNTIG
jgi:hypothetical protein